MQEQDGAILKDQNALIQTLLREHFLREYYSPISFSALRPHLIFRQYATGDVIFEQGDPVEVYCFLMKGRVMVTRRYRQQEERSLMDGPTSLGECPEGQQQKRERTARVVSPEAVLICIPKEAVTCLLAQQMAELDYIIQQLTTFANTSEGIDRMKLAPFVRLEKYRAKEVVKIRQKMGYLVVRGQCRVSSKRREAVVSHFNCLGISAYFHQSQDCTYSAYSSQLVLVVFSYQSITLLPASFLQNLTLLHEAHKLAEVSSLPRIQRSTINNSLHEKSAYCTHKAKKSNSLAQMDDATPEEVVSFRKKIVLGYYPDQAVTSLDFNLKKLKEPKGYFQLKVKAESRVGRKMQRRQWASYLQARSQQKAKSSKQKGNLKQRKQKITVVNPKHHTLAEILNRYHNLPSLGKKHAPLVKSTKSKQCLFRQ